MELRVANRAEQAAHSQSAHSAAGRIDGSAWVGGASAIRFVFYLY